jgi:hypothetical protein
MYIQSPNKPKKFKQMSARKLMATAFWDRKGVLMVEFSNRDHSVRSVLLLLLTAHQKLLSEYPSYIDIS